MLGDISLLLLSLAFVVVVVVVVVGRKRDVFLVKPSVAALLN